MYEINYSWEEKVLLPSYTLPSLNFPSFLSLRRSHEIVEHISVITYHLFFNFPSILPLFSSFTRELIWNKKRTYKCKCLDRYTSNFLSFFFFPSQETCSWWCSVWIVENRSRRPSDYVNRSWKLK